MEDKAKAPARFFRNSTKVTGLRGAISGKSEFKMKVAGTKSEYDLRITNANWPARCKSSERHVWTAQLKEGNFGSCDTEMAAQLKTGALMSSLQFGNTSVLHIDENVEQLTLKTELYKKSCGDNKVEGR